MIPEVPENQNVTSKIKLDLANAELDNTLTKLEIEAYKLKLEVEQCTKIWGLDGS
ncbi:MAG: hypothetical protein NUV80_04250 [Candidatus Berkelbacteria bacterium]|nr:hypothetical protein [Candidatus Berkelbacteria bacterium]